jgi:hypothetical protein
MFPRSKSDGEEIKTLIIVILFAVLHHIKFLTHLGIVFNTVEHIVSFVTTN